MAIPKKGSRTITVDGVRYRWRIRSKPTYGEGAFASTFSVAVERIDPPSQTALLLETSFPRPDNWLLEPSETVTPHRIANSIKSALLEGWQPAQTGSAFIHPLHPAEAAD